MIDRGRQSILGVLVDVVDYDGALSRIRDAAKARRSYAVSALAVHGVMTGVQNRFQKFRLNSFDLVVPDGQPVRWALNLLYDARLEDRVYGPELSLRALEMAEREQFPVYFYGTTGAILESLLDHLSSKYPALVVAGAEPSKFRTLRPNERTALAQRIKDSGASITFVGLGCPRQEVFVYEMKDLVDMPLLAVGAAFAFIAGKLDQAPSALQRNGLEWLFRLIKEPTRLWKRYLILNPYYLWLVAGQVIGLDYSTTGVKPPVEIGYG
jgi:N-acetylglucosaminyldiphosphoundecaprenol N-acetyl-beta-D-mannosaminyltransferase